MFGYERGKAIATTGFVIYTLISLIMVFAYALDFWFDITFFGLIQINGYIYALSYFVAGIGYLFMWLERREGLDFITGLCLGIMVIMEIFLFRFNVFARVVYFLLFLVMALRARRFNLMLSVLFIIVFLCEAFLFPIIISQLVDYFSYSLWPIFSLIGRITELCGAGLCFIEIRNEYK